MLRRLTALIVFSGAAMALADCAASGGNVAVTLSPASDDSLSQSGVTCSQNGAQFSASGTLTNVTKGLVVFSSADLTLYDASGNELGTKDSALVPVQPGNCDVAFTAGPPPG